MSEDRKKYLLRIPHELYEVYERWAADDFRSVNAQIEATLVDAARRAGRLGRQRGAADGPDRSESPERNDTKL